MTQDTREIARQLIEEDLNTGDPAVAERIIHPDFIDHTNPPHLQHGLAGHRGIVDLFHTAFPDVSWVIDDMVADDDRVAMRLTMTGTHQGDFFGIPPSGRRVQVEGTHIVRIADGRVAEHWGHNDDLGLMRALGVVPDPSAETTATALLEDFTRAVGGDVDRLRSICTPDIEFTDPMANVRGAQEVERYLATWWDAFPDATVSIAGAIESGDQAVGEMRYTGTHTGPLRGAQGEVGPTGRAIHLQGAAWITVRDNRVARFRGYYDTMAMMAQLGLMPAAQTA